MNGESETGIGVMELRGRRVESSGRARLGEGADGVTQMACTTPVHGFVELGKKQLCTGWWGQVVSGVKRRGNGNRAGLGRIGKRSSPAAKKWEGKIKKKSYFSP